LATQDFRDVRFKLQGTTEKPRIKDLKIEQKITQTQQEAPAQGKDIQAAPQEQEPSSPQEILQKKVLEKIFGD
jgi:type II secretory pathway component PulC